MSFMPFDAAGGAGSVNVPDGAEDLTEKLESATLKDAKVISGA